MVLPKRGLVLGATAAMLTTVAITGAGLQLSQSQAFFSESPKELVDEVWQIINRQYLDATFNQVDWRAVRNEYLDMSYDSKEDAYDAIQEMLDKLEDPYTRFLKPEEFETLQIDTSGELLGIGIQIALDEETGDITVVAPIEDTPAFEAGLLAKDTIVEIDGQSTEGMEINDAVSLIRGKPGTSVGIVIRRGTRELEFEIERARIEIHPVRARIEPTESGNIGYIRLTQFSANAVDEMREAIQDFEKQDVAGYVLDLRSNPGGLLYSSIEIARMWLEEGTIVSTVDRRGEVDRQRANYRSLTDAPLVILIDGGSASASEILSGALQDNDRASLVGTQTFGKGLVQSVRSLGDGSGLTVTIAKYLTPSGRDINEEGIEPDSIVELEDSQREALQQDRSQIGTLKDPQFVEALDILLETIASADSAPGDA
ncbi:C-terminal peptidase (prc) [Rubidibacter lacunae KORDI 51-2]|uniref:Carboxyl-terminal-processing protease n=1 Tax=Rubidibacter lacunae KORDI 51-2 TaxID=582515 RepID=U5DPK7_9CHRO|nr:carboxyl-terminal processing protease CtpC [Rubidibacter lacunae]ERN42802.1 C-terminal peptidase (prc) [Rubidibacter lacunae KORDI 51-2]